MQEKIKKGIEQAVRDIYGDIILSDFSVETPEVAEHGDYACNIAMALAGMLKKNPMEIAQELAERVRISLPDVVARVSVAAPGFINIFLNDRVIMEAAERMIARPDSWEKSTEGDGKTVILDYFQLNIAKQPHVGHLRSAVIGDALKRILRARGYHTIADTHVGDWGTQFGVLLYAYKEAIKEDPLAQERIAKNPFTQLQELYTAANGREDIRENGKAEFAKLEQGDRQNRRIWAWMVDISMKKLEDNAARLHLLPFEEHKGESSYEDAMAPIVNMALTKGVAKKTDDGAIVVDLIDENLDEAVLVKSDGATTYLLRDLATIKYRQEAHRFWKNLYIVDNRQSHHFHQLFRVAELLGFEGVGASEHVEFGFMKLPEGAISTRKGNAISLEALLDEAERRARDVIKEKNPNLAGADEVAKQVALGAIKFFDLSHNRKSEPVFRWEEVLSFEGSAGPYIQYTHARLKSILRKAGESKHHVIGSTVLNNEEHGLLFCCIRLPEIMGRVIETLSPHLLAAHLFEIAQRANEFYHTRSVLAEKDEDKKQFMLALVQTVAIALATGLHLLGIDSPNEM